jgi:thioredoxin 1
MNINNGQASVAEIGEWNFTLEVLKSKQPVLVAFLAPWSRPCQILGPVLDDVAIVCAGRVKVVRVNADDYPELSLWYDIQSIPALLCFVEGSVQTRVVGTASKEAILAKLEPFLHSA